MKKAVREDAGERVLGRANATEAALIIGGLLIALVWSYWRVISGLLRDWGNDANYSVGQLVPLIVIYLVWHGRKRLRDCPIVPCWWGALVVAAGLLVRERGLVLFYESGERAGLLLTVYGLVLWVGGYRLTWRLRWALVMLALMIPLPGRVHNMIAGPLQGFATIAAVALLELSGIAVTREGHTLVLNESVTVAVAEACSGLRMLTAFVVVSATFAYLVNRPAWQRAILVASSIPIAIVCNVVRLSATAILYLLVSDETASTFFHDFAGVTMMPLAILFLAGELKLLSMLVIPDEQRPHNPRSAGPSSVGPPRRGRHTEKKA